MKKILGLDLGTNSIGWAILECLPDGNKRIIKMGSRIVSMDGTEVSDFKKGQPQTKNAKRREKKGIRVCNKRYKMRRNKLIYVLQKLDLLPNQIQLSQPFNDPLQLQKVNVLPIKKGTTQLTAKAFIKIRAKAIHEEVSRKEFGRILYSFNQLRGYAGGDDEDEEFETAAVLGIVKNKVHTAQDHKVDHFTILSIEKTEEKKKEKHIYTIRVEDRTKKIYEGETVVKSLSVNDTVELNKLTRRNTKTGEVTSIVFSIPNKTNWRKQMENLENDLDELSKESGRKTYISEYFLDKLNKNRWERIRNTVILRSRYVAEFDAIWKTQFNAHLSHVDEKTIREIAHFLFPGSSKTQEKYRKEAIEGGLYHIIRNQIIYFQREPKPQSHLIADCRFEPNKKAIAKSHPLYQEFKIWEQINKLSIWRKIPNGYTKENKPKFKYEKKTIPSAFKAMLFNELQEKKELRFAGIFGKLKKTDFFDENADFFKGLSTKSKLKGNTTRLFLKERLGRFWKVLQMGRIQNQIELWNILYHKKGNEYEKDSDRNLAIASYLRSRGIEDKDFDKIVVAISCIKFPRDYASISLDVVEKVLPLVRAGSHFDNSLFSTQINEKIHTLLNAPVSDMYDKSLQAYLDKNENEVLKNGGWINAHALMLIYGQHTAKSISEEEMYKTFQDIAIVKRHSLRNPLVEQMINETLMVVKDIWRHYGKPYEIRVELARELKNSIKERGKIHDNNKKNQKENTQIKARLEEINKELTNSNVERYKLWKNQKNDTPAYIKKYEATKNEVDKMKLWEEQGHIDPYTNDPIPLSTLFDTGKYDVDHIIPKSRYFDDSLSNKVICARKVNKDKDNRTAMEYIEAGSLVIKNLLSPEEFTESVGNRFYGKKRNMLLATKLPEDPIERQKKDTQYISSKIREELSKIVGDYNVKTSTGGVTHYLRNHWGLTNNFKELLKERFQKFYDLKAGLEYKKEVKAKGEEHVGAFEGFRSDFMKYHIGKKNNKPFIKEYSKRYDHRHHAMDALVVACTDEKAVKRLNDLNQHLQDWIVKKAKEGTLKIDPESDDILEQFLTQAKTVRKEIMKDIEKFRNVPLPWKGFNEDFKTAIQEIIVSHKPKDKLQLQYDIKERNGKRIKERVIKIRGQLHEETVYGLSNRKESYRIPLTKFSGTRFATEKNIHKITNEFLRTIIQDHFENVYKKKKADAFGAEGIKVLHKRLAERTILKNGEIVSAPHPPIHSVKIYRKKNDTGITLQKMDRATSYNDSLYVKTSNNYLYAVFEKNGKRTYDIISLFEAVEYLKDKFNAASDKIGFDKQQAFNSYFENSNEGTFLFSLKISDMVYLPEPNEDTILDNDSSMFSSFWKHKDRVKNIYVVKRCSGKQIYFLKHTFAEVIENEVELQSQNALEFVSGRKIAEHCYPIRLDRLGNIIEVNGNEVQ